MQKADCSRIHGYIAKVFVLKDSFKLYEFQGGKCAAVRKKSPAIRYFSNSVGSLIVPKN